MILLSCIHVYTCRYTDYNDLVVHVYMYIGTLTIMILLYMYTCRYTDYNDLVQVPPTFSLHLTSAMFLLFSYHLVYLDPYLHVYIHNYSTRVTIDLHVLYMYGSVSVSFILPCHVYIPYL